MDNPHLYVYGVIPAGVAPRISTPGVVGDGAPVRTVDSGGLAALTSEVPPGALEGGRTDVMRHAEILREAMEFSTVLPMRFGVVLPSVDAVRAELLEAHADELSGQLHAFEGRAEVNIKAFYHEDVALREVIDENPSIRELHAAIQGKPPDASYYERIRMGELVAAALEAKREVDSDRLVERLAPLVVDVREGEIVHERMVCSVSFLVERAALEHFDAAIERLGADVSERLRLKYVGPLPPHSFVELPAEAT